MRFKQWIEQTTLGTEFVDERQIDAAYDKAKYSVKLVQLYDQMTGQKLLTNISTIATLQQGVYGLYNSAENKKVLKSNLSPKIVGELEMKFGKDVFSSNKISRIPNAVIKQYVPSFDTNLLVPSDVIRINVQKHLQSHGDSIQAIIEIASTIVHECTHELELQTTGKTSEIGPEVAEKKFLAWIKQNWNTILTRIPQLKTLG
jgi:hypothetical protein